jgi:hypothetical protein
MILGALVDAGLPLKSLQRELKKIPIEGYDLEARKVTRCSLSATQVVVSIPHSRKSAHRSFSEIKDAIARSRLKDSLKEKGIAIFEKLVQAESKVHQTAPDKIKLHEIGARDAIIDIMGAIIGFDLMGVDRLYASPLPSGHGNIKTDHGYYPVPAPVTMELLSRANAPLIISEDPWLGEMVTPTGAAIITSLASFQRPVLTLERIGYGAGSRDLPQIPNVLRLWMGKEIAGEENLVLLETNIDDMNPQIAGYVMERLFRIGAKDVWFTPIFMKKNRPAILLSVLAPWEKEQVLVEAILRETTTLGLRVRPIARREAERELIKFASSLGKVNLKVKKIRGALVSLSPEYEDCRRLAQKRGLSLQEAFRIVEEEARKKLLSDEPTTE